MVAAPLPAFNGLKKDCCKTIREVVKFGALHTIERRYNAVQYNRIFHTTVQWLKHYINQSLFPYSALPGDAYCENFREN